MEREILFSVFLGTSGIQGSNAENRIIIHSPEVEEKISSIKDLHRKKLKHKLSVHAI